MLVAVVLLPASLLAVEAVAAPVESAAAVSGSDFDPGLIVSDDIFYDSAAMSSASIQSFLNSHIGSCLNSQCLNVATVNYAGRPREVSSSGNVVCESIAGGTMLVSELIYRVQVACGISAKVILVTLQKEQGLVSSRAPSSTALMHAMGMACPDTAPCDSAFAGLATQIVTGSRQLKGYRATGFARQIGTYYIGYSPNSECGGTNVHIQSYGTAALYNYTPYQPNAAALANLGGTGDGCSSYGNRNFWVYFNNWFGSSVNIDPLRFIADRYAQAGGASGSLGPVVTTPSCGATSTSCIATYQHGLITWKRGVGTYLVQGAIGQYALAHPSLTGAAMTDQQDVTDPHGNGSAQQFVNGWIHTSSAGTFWSPTSIMSAYSAAGWLRGFLGWPTSDPVCGGQAKICFQRFAGGAIAVSPAGASTIVSKDVADFYQRAGGPTGALGYPVGLVKTVSDVRGNGSMWQLDGGWIYSSAIGTFSSSPAVVAAYTARGGPTGSLAWPKAAEACTTTGCTQAFSGGTISLDAATSMSDAAIARVWTAAGGASGSLGLPMGKPSAVKDPNGNGTAQEFERGWIHSGPAGTYSTPTSVMREYSNQGWLRGWLGWPIADAVCDSTGCTQDFSGGTIVISAQGAATSMPAVNNPQIRALWTSLGGVDGSLGPAVAAAQTITDPHGNGVAQRFASGWIHSSTAGTFATSNALMVAYSSNGWLRGPLGWPSGAQNCTANGCSQQFAGGVLYAPTSGTAFLVAPVTNAQIRALYDTLGDGTGSLGYAMAPVQAVSDPHGDGFAQKFEHGWIHSSAKGTFWSSTSIMTAYSAGGWLRGPLGWPTTNPVCGGTQGYCVQLFSGGVIDGPSSGASSLMPAGIGSAYIASGGTSGSWGFPAAPPQTVTDSNGNGFALPFDKGWAHSSSHGTYLSSATIMAAYGPAGWLRGTLGWPTSAETCDGSGCGQTFMGGAIRYSFGGAAFVVPAVSNTAIKSAWTAAGGASGSLGSPIAAAQSVTDPNGNGWAQQFERGWIHSSSAGTFATPSAIMTHYSAMGWVRAPGGIGWPTGAVSCTATMCAQTFQKATVQVPVGQLMTDNGIASAWQALGGVGSFLGYPLAAPQVVTDPNGNGVAQQFERGWIHSSAAGVFWSPTVIMTAYSSQGWIRGSLGWPTANAQCVVGGCTQTFQHGSIDTR